MPALIPSLSRPDETRAVTFVHTADWHLGKPFAGIAEPMKRARVQQERIEAIRRIGEVVRARRAGFVVVAGDLFDSPTPTHDTVSAALGAVGAIGVPVYAIAGNHDHTGPGSVWTTPFFGRERDRLAPEFHLLRDRVPTRVELTVGGEGPCRAVLLPCPLRRRREPEDPTAWIRTLDFEALGEGPRIVIAHGSTATFSSGAESGQDDDGGPSGGGNRISVDRLPIDEIDYVALGDWHGLVEAGPKAWYSGTPEIDRFPKRDQRPGQIACVSVARGSQPIVSAVGTGRLRWIGRHVTLDSAPSESDAGDGSLGPARLDAVLMDATQQRDTAEPGFEGCLVSLTLAGAVSLAGRKELDRVIESWRARLLRLDLQDEVRVAATAEEIRDLAGRPGDPIISRVAAELVRRLEQGGAATTGPSTDPDIVRHALTILHSLATPDRRLPTDPGATPQ